MTSALILVDLMLRIVSLDLAPHTGEDVVDRCRRLATKFRANGRPVIQVRVERPTVAQQPPGSDFVEGLVQAGDIIVVKRTIGAFHNTDLHKQLQSRGARVLVMAGLVTNMGVESTARAANDYGYELEFVADAMSGLAADEHDFAIAKIFPRFGKVQVSAFYC
jgi:nicotinamidase-related amidase